MAPKLLRTLRGARGLLVSSGWWRSYRNKAPQTRDGKPLPWYSLPAIRFLESRPVEGLRVFEFGAGNSTRWWISRGAVVVAREHDPEWATKLRKQIKLNALIEDHPAASRDYVASPKGSYHIIVIDGRRRVECARNCLSALAEDGVIVWDNANRERYAEGLAFLSSQGFRRIDLWGVAPGAVKLNDTAIFYRDGNCLGI